MILKFSWNNHWYFLFDFFDIDVQVTSVWCLGVHDSTKDLGRKLRNVNCFLKHCLSLFVNPSTPTNSSEVSSGSLLSTSPERYSSSRLFSFAIIVNLFLGILVSSFICSGCLHRGVSHKVWTFSTVGHSQISDHVKEIL